MSTLKFEYGHASAKLIFIDPGLYALSDLRSESLNQGHARQVMLRVMHYADKHDLLLRLIVQQNRHPDPQAMDNDQLETFYSKYGFKRDSGSTRPYTMTRYPSRDLQAP